MAPFPIQDENKSKSSSECNIENNAETQVRSGRASKLHWHTWVFLVPWIPISGDGAGVFSESAPKLNFGTFEESLSYHIKLFMLYRWIRKERLCNFVYFCLHSQHVISCSHPAGPPIIHRQSCLKDREWLKWWLIIYDIIKPHLGSPGIDTFW